jgi:hypothetical protein
VCDPVPSFKRGPEFFRNGGPAFHIRVIVAARLPLALGQNSCDQLVNKPKSSLNGWCPVINDGGTLSGTP